ncbi:hypothetical protein CK203_005481 [Vitis vinifera]|uniref:Uncharacterized protein n=1 Tax=Vitis vinifera TaxID=29760 RepID=A0A438K3E7_VITVI|nr:hypothetical protein CK203_005481 [Vitis vinifera]
MSSPGQRGYVSGCPMNIKLLSWNVREANDSVKRKVFKSVVRNKRWIVLHSGDKNSSLANRVVRSLGPGRYLDWKALDACGSTGDSGMWKMGLFGCLRVFMARLPEKKGSVCGKKLGQLEEFGKNLGV